MTDTKDLTKTKRYIHLLSDLAGLDFLDHEDLIMLKEIKEIVEERESLLKDNLEIQQNYLFAPPGDDLVEELKWLDIVEKMMKKNIDDPEAEWMYEDLEIVQSIRKLLQAKPAVDIKRLAHLLYISIPPHKEGLSYEVITKNFEERLKGELGEPK